MEIHSTDAFSFLLFKLPGYKLPLGCPDLMLRLLLLPVRYIRAEKFCLPLPIVTGLIVCCCGGDAVERYFERLIPDRVADD
jgi:hypothetical protein